MTWAASPEPNAGRAAMIARGRATLEANSSERIVVKQTMVGR